VIISAFPSNVILVYPSSLVLVAILGVWAAYLVPHWLRRRDELAQSRTRDRFSGGLRVLQRRRRRPARSAHRSGDPVLTSPRLVIDADGELLYIPADRAVAAESKKRAYVAQADVAQTDDTADAPATGVRPDAASAVAAESDPELAAEAEMASKAELAPEPAPAQPAIHSEPVAAARLAAPPYRPSSLSRPAPAAPPASPTSEPGQLPAAERPRNLETAIGTARAAARRRAGIMILLLVASAASWGVALGSSVTSWVAAPVTALLVLHVLASRVAGLRSREALTVLAAQVRAADLAEARPQRQATAGSRPNDVAAVSASTAAEERVARRAAAVGAETWEPVPVPPPTYTLKPAVHRPEPAPLGIPAAHTGAPAAAVSRAALPRTAADVERILALDSDLDDLFGHRKAVNG
jgi:type II secretory pathway pseudopilin PulG